MTTVYGSSSGRYSDYSVSDVLFTTPELAEQYHGPFNDDAYDGPRLETFTVHDRLPDKVSGVIRNFWYGMRGYRREDVPYELSWWPGVNGPEGLDARFEYSDDMIRLVVQGVDREQVDKVYSERRAYLLAEAPVMYEAWKARCPAFRPVTPNP